MQRLIAYSLSKTITDIQIVYRNYYFPSYLMLMALIIITLVMLGYHKDAHSKQEKNPTGTHLLQRVERDNCG